MSSAEPPTPMVGGGEHPPAVRDDKTPPPVVGGHEAQAPVVGGDGQAPLRIAKTVSVGEKFEIRLEANATTGYSWVVDAGNSQGLDKLTATGESYAVGEVPPMVVGAPGTQVFHYLAVAPGQVRIAFRYRRPWDPLRDVRLAEARITVE